MCGIAGAFIYDPDVARLDCLTAVVAASAARGEDAFGVVRWSPSTGFRRHARHGRGDINWLDVLGAPTPGEATIYLHTSRAEPTTEWRREKTDADIPPFVGEGVAVAHNGIIANDDALASQHGLHRSSFIDTAVIPPLVARLGAWNAVAELKGGNALAILDSRQGTLALFRNFLPLALAWEPGIVCFASEAGFFPDAGRPFRPYQAWELPPYSGLELSAQGSRGPLTWGAGPAEAQDAAWDTYPALCWKSHG